MPAYSTSGANAKTQPHERDSFPKKHPAPVSSLSSRPADPSHEVLASCPSESALMSAPEAFAEAKWVMTHLRPEPEALAQRREELLQELDARIAATKGSLQTLLTRLRAVLLSRRPGAAFQPRFAAEFAQALTHYKQCAEAGEPPAIIGQCFLYLREHVAGTGLSPLLAVVDTTHSLRKVSDTWRPWQQQRF